MLVALDSEPIRRVVVAANRDLDVPVGSRSRIPATMAANRDLDVRAGSRSRFPATRNGHLAPAGTARLALSAITRHRLPPSSGRRSVGRRAITTSATLLGVLSGLWAMWAWIA